MGQLWGDCRSSGGADPSASDSAESAGAGANAQFLLPFASRLDLPQKYLGQHVLLAVVGF